jgi:hypothetical protein
MAGASVTHGDGLPSSHPTRRLDIRPGVWLPIGGIVQAAFGPPIMISKIGRMESYRLSDESEESIDEDGRRHEAQ